MPKLKTVIPRNRLRTEQNITPADRGGNFVGGALDAITGMIREEKQYQAKTKIEELKTTLKSTEDTLKELKKLPPVEKRKEAKSYYETQIENNRGMKGAIRGINKAIDIRRLDRERDDIYQFAQTQGLSPEDAMLKIIRSEEELMGILDKDPNYTAEEKKEMIDKYTEIGNQKSNIYQGIWAGIEGTFTKEEFFNTVGIIKNNATLFDIDEMTNMTKVLVEAGLEAGTIGNAEASTIMATIGDSNLNRVLEGVRDSDVSDEEKAIAYGMIQQAIENRAPEFYQNLGYEPFSYGTASTQFNTFKTKVENEVAVNRQELRKLQTEKKKNFAESWQNRGNSFNGDYRTTSQYTEAYIEETHPQFLDMYIADPRGTMEQLYVENAMPDFNYLSEFERENVSSVFNDENQPHDKKYALQLNLQQHVLGRVPYDSIEFEMFNQQVYEQGGFSPEIMQGLGEGEDRNLQGVSQKVQAGKFLNQGALGKLDALTLMEAVQASSITQINNKEFLTHFDALNLLADEPGYGRMVERFQTEFSRLLSWHLKRGTTTMDQSMLDKILGSTSPTEALLTGGLPMFEAIIGSDEFVQDVQTLIRTYTNGRTITIDNTTGEPVIMDVPGVTQDNLDNIRELDSKKKLYFLDVDGNFVEADETKKQNMVINVTKSNYGYYLEGGEAYEKLDSGQYIPYSNSIQSFVGTEGTEPRGTFSRFLKKVKEGVANKQNELENAIIMGDGSTKALPNYLTGDGTYKAQDGTYNMPMDIVPPKSRGFFEGLGNFLGIKSEKEVVASGVAGAIGTPDTPTPPMNKREEDSYNILYNKIYQEGRRSEGVYSTRYKSKESGTDTIGVGHKMTKAEHQGNYVVINGRQRDLKEPLTPTEIEQLFRQDYAKHMDITVSQLAEYGVDYNSLADEFKEIAFRIAFNTGTIFRGMAEGIAENDMQKFNTSLISNVRMTDQSTGKSYTSAGLARDRAKFYNMVNDVPIDHVIFKPTESGGSQYTYYDVYGNEVATYTRKFPLKTGKNGNQYNKAYKIGG